MIVINTWKCVNIPLPSLSLASSVKWRKLDIYFDGTVTQTESGKANSFLFPWTPFKCMRCAFCSFFSIHFTSSYCTLGMNNLLARFENWEKSFVCLKNYRKIILNGFRGFVEFTEISYFDWKDKQVVNERHKQFSAALNPSKICFLSSLPNNINFERLNVWRFFNQNINLIWD